MCFGTKQKQHNNNKTKKGNIKTSKWNTGPLAPQSDALPLKHRMYLLQ